MKIAFIAYDWPGYHGGPIVNARRLLPELQRRGHEVHAIIQYYREGSPSAEMLKAQGVHVHLTSFHTWTEDRVSWILDTLQEINPDVFVPNLSVAGWYASRWAREAGIPTVAAYRSDDAFHAGLVDEFVLGQPEWAVSGLVCVSQSAHDRIAAKNPKRTRLCVIPSGVPLPAIQADQTTYDSFKLVYVGRLVQEQKRIFDLLDALSLVMHRLPHASATLIGHGRDARDSAEVTKRIHALKLEQRIKLMGAIDPDDLHQVLVNHHVLVLLSDYEGMPGAVMDGMACGLVPVCLDTPPGVRELVIHEETGLLVPDRGEVFVSAVERLAADKALRQKLAQSARQHIMNGYSLTVAADRWERFLSQLITLERRKSSIVVPKQYGLPPVNKGLEREDHRRPAFYMRALTSIRQILRHWLRAWHSQVDSSASFLNPRATIHSLDTFIIRGLILEAVKAHRQQLRGRLLDIGCGQMPYKSILTSPKSEISEYIGLDLTENPIHNNKPDICWDGIRIPLDDSYIDSVLCTEVLEHCQDPSTVLAEAYRVLRPGGLILLTVPFLWPLHEVPFDEYRYTPFALERHLNAAGFTDIELRATGGWDASLAQLLGLWVRRRPMNRWIRLMLSVILLPLIRLLVSVDRKKVTHFKEGTMITSISGTARKPR